MDWKPVVEAEMNKLAKIFEKLEPSMGEEIVQRMGGDFNLSDPVYSGWSSEELEEERIRKEGGTFWTLEGVEDKVTMVVDCLVQLDGGKWKRRQVNFVKQNKRLL